MPVTVEQSTALGISVRPLPAPAGGMRATGGTSRDDAGLGVRRLMAVEVAYVRLDLVVRGIF